MELLNAVKMIPLPFLILVIVIFAVITLVMVIQYVKQRGLENIREDAYQLILKAEHKFNESGQGKQKLKWVVSQARLLLPTWLKWFVTEEMLEKIIDVWFRGVKDLLDDGKLNKSQKK